ncbi:MAG: malate dehydrogenase [Chloroflexi bacterium]|nr:malate dehydrogenase [Chloroflexota bacterium]
MRKKVTVIGAGNVGATCAHWIANRDLADVVLIDIVEGMPQGKALDLQEASPVEGFDSRITGTNDYADTAGSDIAIITAGVPRRKDPETGEYPSRDELVKTNQQIVGSVVRQFVEHSPDSILIIVSNPLDAMCHVAFHESGFPKERVIGQAGMLDTARYKTFIAMELGLSPKDVHGIVLGGHGDSMVPLPHHTSVSGIPVLELIDETTLDGIIQRTRKGGGEIVGLLGYSGYYAPASASVAMVESILKDQKRVMPCACYLEGEYGYENLFIGVPAVLGAGGIEQVIEMNLSDEEKAMLDNSANAVRAVVDVLGYEE